ncbi:MAG: hypothetical protein WCJ74_01020 [bacterium]
MPKPTKYDLNKYIKAIKFFASIKFGAFECYPKGGSVYTFKLYQKKADSVPCSIWSVHVEHNKKKSIWPRDLQKAWTELGVSKEDFIKTIESL